MAIKPSVHWTNESTETFAFRVSADFVGQLEKVMDSEGITQADLASTLKVSESRVSQILNNPGNLTLKKMIEYARALHHKVSIVAYDDGDHRNLNGPIHSEVFACCWENAGRPANLFLDTSSSTSGSSKILLESSHDIGLYLILDSDEWSTPTNMTCEMGEIIFGGGSSVTNLLRSSR